MLEENEERRPGVVSYLTRLGRFREWRDCVWFQFRERFRSSSRERGSLWRFGERAAYEVFEDKEEEEIIIINS
jgi:hypothetical protein|tara:strand:+ start:220 stop:438 length:219 start_codon:yes stop_codon:yes gene_type:complete